MKSHKKAYRRKQPSQGPKEALLEPSQAAEHPSRSRSAPAASASEHHPTWNAEDVSQRIQRLGQAVEHYDRDIEARDQEMARLRRTRCLCCMRLRRLIFELIMPVCVSRRGTARSATCSSAACALHFARICLIVCAFLLS